MAAFPAPATAFAVTSGRKHEIRKLWIWRKKQFITEPQENTNRTDVRWMKLSNDVNRGK